jgi:hypothetical protein
MVRSLLLAAQPPWLLLLLYHFGGFLHGKPHLFSVFDVEHAVDIFRHVAQVGENIPALRDVVQDPLTIPPIFVKITYPLLQIGVTLDVPVHVELIRLIFHARVHLDSGVVGGSAAVVDVPIIYHIRFSSRIEENN